MSSAFSFHIYFSQAIVINQVPKHGFHCSCPFTYHALASCTMLSRKSSFHFFLIQTGFYFLYSCFSGTANSLLNDFNSWTDSVFTSYYICIPLSVSENTFHTNINTFVYPNPTNGKVNINQTNQKIKNIKIFNYSGQLQQEHFTTIFSLANLPTGLYFVTVQTDKGIYVNKLIKQ